MSKKLNPIIFRLGKKLNWNFKFFEKNSFETSKYLIKIDLLENLLINFFKKFYLSIDNLKIFCKKASVYIFFNYFFLVANKSNKLKLLLFNKLNNKNFNFIKKTFLKFMKFNKKKYFFLFNKFIWNKFCLNNLNTNFSIKIYLKRFNFLKFLKFLKLKSKNFVQLKIVNFFFQKLFFFLNKIFNNKTIVCFIIKQINLDFKFLKQKQKQKLLINLLKFNKFKNNNFYKLGINLVFCFSKNLSLTFLILNYIKIMFKKIKKQKVFTVFILFLKYIFKYFLLKSKLIKGLILLINGNLSKKQRAIKKSIQIGKNINNLQLNNFLNYNYTTSFTKKGSLGIKIYFKI